VILEGFGATLMAIAMVAAFLLVFGGIKLARRKEERGRGFLMIGAAAVVVMNVLIWTV
jgi:hypothetical protein